MRESQDDGLEEKSGLVLLVRAAGLWRTTPVTQTPAIVLTNWRVFSVPLTRRAGCTRHFVGYNLTEHEGRVSSPIVEFDSQTMCGSTRTGRVYELRGATGWDNDAEYVWRQWLNLHDLADSTEIQDISAEISVPGAPK